MAINKWSTLAVTFLEFLETIIAAWRARLHQFGSCGHDEQNISQSKWYCNKKRMKLLHFILNAINRNKDDKSFNHSNFHIKENWWTEMTSILRRFKPRFLVKPFSTKIEFLRLDSYPNFQINSNECTTLNEEEYGPYIGRNLLYVVRYSSLFGAVMFRRNNF